VLPSRFIFALPLLLYSYRLFSFEREDNSFHVSPLLTPLDPSPLPDELKFSPSQIFSTPDHFDVGDFDSYSPPPLRTFQSLSPRFCPLALGQGFLPSVPAEPKNFVMDLNSFYFRPRLWFCSFPPSSGFEGVLLRDTSVSRLVLLLFPKLLLSTLSCPLLNEQRNFPPGNGPQ